MTFFVTMARVSEVPVWLLVLSLAFQLRYCDATADYHLKLARFWQENVPAIQMPSALQRLASPLSPVSTRFFLEHLKNGTLSSFSEQFCASAKLYCSQKDLPNPRVCIPPFFKYEYGTLPCGFAVEDSVNVAAAGRVFFRISALHIDSTVTVPDLANDLQDRHFLPRDLSQLIPFNEEALPQVQRLLNISGGANMQYDMKDTLHFCTIPPVTGEVKECETSIESMVVFARRNLGSTLQVRTPSTLLLSHKEEPAKVKSLTPVNAVGEKMISCHNLMYPYLVYSCHMSTTSQLLTVGLESSSGGAFHGMVVCHFATETWDPHHISFRVLDLKPGMGEVCHWLPQNTFVWT
eukprot:c128_g1_i1 orf=432-1478(+)